MKQLLIGKTIQRLRKSRGLTQEHLADAVGVSSAAVSKWESDNTYPDISLLGPIARVLGTDVDELLGYRPLLTEEEVMSLSKEGQKLFETGKCQEAIDFCEARLLEYPNDLFLKFRMASLFMQYMAADKTEGFAVAMLKRSIELFEASSKSSNVEIRDASYHVLSGLYMMNEEHDKALEAVEKLPRYDYDSRMMKSNILYTMGNLEESEKLDQTCLYGAIRDAGLNLISLAKTARKKGDIDRALKLLDTALDLDALFGLDKIFGKGFNHYFMKAEIFMETGQHEMALDALELFAGSILREGGRIPDNPYYFNLLDWNDTGASNEYLLSNAHFLIETTDSFKILKDNPRFQKILSLFKQ